MNVDPRKIKYYIPADYVLNKYGHPRRLKGRQVQDAEILQHKTSLFDEPKIKYCVRHFAEGIAWKDLPIESAPDARYFKLDCIYREAKESGILRDIYGNNVLIHLIDGEPYFAGGGYHRLAIALILGLHEIPVDVSLICTTKGGECER